MANDVDVTKLLGAPQNPPAKPQPVGSGRISKSPAPTLLLGLGMFAIWLILTMVDLETSEALFTHVAPTSFTPEWQLLLQIPQILVGQHVPIAYAKAAIVGWVLVLCTITCMVGYDLAKDAVRHANHRLEKGFGSGLIILTIIDFIANVLYVPGDGSWFGQVLWALVVTFGGMFFGVVGFRFLEHAFKTWRASY